MGALRLGKVIEFHNDEIERLQRAQIAESHVSLSSRSQSGAVCQAQAQTGVARSKSLPGVGVRGCCSAGACSAGLRLFGQCQAQAQPKQREQAPLYQKSRCTGLL